MKYTRSVDGIERVSISLDVRLTREDVALLSKIAKTKGYRSIKEYLNETIDLTSLIWYHVNDDIAE